jgi:hypothetical protein
MKTNISGRVHRKKHAQKMLLEFDKELGSQCESIEDHMFDRKNRNMALKNGEFTPPSGTLFEAIFQELKRKEEREKNRHSLSSMISRLHARSAKKQLAENPK